MRRAAPVLAGFLLLCACGPEPDRALLYAHSEARSPFFRLDKETGFYRAARPGAAASAFPAVKAPGVFRVFVAGGSIARLYEGPGALADVLPPLLPGRTVEVVNAGMAGYDAAREEYVVAEALRLGADAVVLLTGHNESANLPPPLPRWRLRLGLWAASAGLARRAPVEPAAPLAAFEAAVRRMARAARARGVAFVLVRPPLNVRDGAPQGALPRGPAASEGWARRLAGDCAGAREAWARAEADAAPGDAAELVFFTGRCLERERRPADAAAAYARALALEPARRGRCGPACADVLARVASEEGALVADAHAAFAARAGAAGPGLEAFTDRVHWRPDGHAVVSAAIAGALSKAGLCAAPGPVARPAAPPAGAAGWLTTLRYAAQEASRSAPRLSPVALAYLERVLERWPAAVQERVLLSEEDASSPGAAWGQPALAAGAPYVRHLALARQLAGDTAAAARLYAEAGPDASADDVFRAGARRLTPEGAREEKYAAAAASRLAAAARWTAAASSGTLAALAAADPAGARAAAADPALSGLAEALYAAVGDLSAARSAACRPGRGVAGDMACARREAVGGSKDRAKAAARRALAAEPEGPLARSAAILLQDLGEPVAAAGVLRRLSDLAPGDAGLACDAGTASFLAGDRQGAEASFKRAGAPCGR